MATDRKQAIALGAVDARKLIDTIPGLMPALSADQIRQIQRVLDAAIVNPVIQKEADDLYRRSVTAQIGNQVNRDPEIVKRAYKTADQMIPVSEQDRHVRLDYQKLLTSDALSPRTDNPDEANYLVRVRNTLSAKGIWLRISQPLVRDPDDRSRHIRDPKQWQLWLSLGYDGDAIPTKDGKVDRDELLATTMLGAGYYRAVHTGDVQTILKRELARLSVDLETGIAEHNQFIARKRQAAPGVAEVSDFVGGADLPSRSIWDAASRLHLKALFANVGGNVLASRVYLVIAAIIVRNNAELIAEYAKRSGAGAAIAIRWLQRAKTAGKVAEAALVVTGVGAGIRALRGGTTAATEVVARSAVDDAAEKLALEYAKKNGISASELSIPRYVTQPKGTILGGRKAGQSSGAGTGFHRW